MRRCIFSGDSAQLVIRRAVQSVLRRGQEAAKQSSKPVVSVFAGRADSEVSELSSEVSHSSSVDSSLLSPRNIYFLARLREILDGVDVDAEGYSPGANIRKTTPLWYAIRNTPEFRARVVEMNAAFSKALQEQQESIANGGSVY